MRTKYLQAALAAIGLGTAALANATVLLPGGGPLAVDILASAPGGAILASESVEVTTAHWTGTFRAAVVDGPEAGVNLDFYYQISNALSSTDSLGRVTGSDFINGFTTSLFQTATAFDGFVTGTQLASSGDRDMLGVVGFNFVPGNSGTGKVDPGESSYILIVRTNATQFQSGFSAVINGTATTVASYMPAGSPPLVGPVPEPGTMALIGSGLLAFGGIARKRKQQQ
jgi:hypothetical protein